MSKIVLLYNDQDVELVGQIRRELKERFSPAVDFWIADQDLKAKDSLIGGIVNAIRTASGVMIFVGPHGLGRFQERIELEAVWAAIWQKGEDFERVLVHLGPDIIPPDFLLTNIVPVNRKGELTDPDALAVAIASKFAFGTAAAAAATPPVIAEKILFLYHGSDRSDVRRLQASLRRKLDEKRYLLYSQDNLSSFGEAPDLLLNALTKAWAVFVVVGANGPGAELKQLAQSARQDVADQGGKPRRATILLGGRQPPDDLFPGWSSIGAPAPLNYEAAAEDLVKVLQLESRWTLEVAIKTAIMQFGEANVPQKRFSEVARSLTEGKPLTLLLGPYAVPEPESCPSRVRQALLDLLRKQPSYNSLFGSESGPRNNEFIPPLWTDHLATLCLLADCNRDEIETTISDVVSAHEGDADGKPAPLFRQVSDFVQQFRRYGPPRSPALPAVTILTVCPGLRMERALVSRGCAFERVTMLFGSDGWQKIDQNIYLPSDDNVQKAAEGDPDYMPAAQTRRPGDDQQVQFVRLIKLGGSRDLKDSMAIEFGQGYRLMAEFQTKLAPFVSAAGQGPYLALGAGLATPPLQAAHALLLRTALQNAIARPQLALVGNVAKLPDPLWQAEMGRLATLIQTPQSGFERIEIVDGPPEVFLQALSVAFSGAPARVET